MALLNYTTEVSVGRTLGDIQTRLAEAGARGVAVEYDGKGRPTSVRFAATTPHGVRTFALPVRSEAVQAVLVRDKVAQKYRTPEHADRVAWRIIKDWIEAQLALLRTEMVTLDQLMLPYMVVDGGTVYQRYVEQRLALETSDA